MADMSVSSTREARIDRGARFFARVLHPRAGLLLFCAGLLIVYGIIPLVLYWFYMPDEYMGQLSLLTLISVLSIYAGSRINVFDARFSPGAKRFRIEPVVFVGITWSIFGLFLAVTYLTAPSIPFLSAISGASANVLSEERGAFLKGRVGAEAALVYVSTFLVNTVLPYSIVLLYASGSRIRHVCAAVFFAFSISFLQKALFLNLFLPLIAYFALAGKLPTRKALGVGLVAIGLLVLGTALAKGYANESFGEAASAAEYFSARYAPVGSFDYFLWRAFAVPVFTASDSLAVFAQWFNSDHLLGATSSLFSWVFGIERINLERFVFQFQFGGWNETANSNAVFLVDGYTNFGYVGVILFSLFVGLVFRWFRLSQDIAFKALWPLFAFTIYSSPLIGMMLSNGFLYMLVHSLYFRVERKAKQNSG